MTDIIKLTASQTSISSDLQRLFDAFPHYLMLIDKHHTIHMVNNKVSSEFGVLSEALIGQSCPEALHQTDSYSHCPLAAAVSSGLPTEVDHYDEPSGRWLSIGVYPTDIYSENGNKLYLHMAQDTTNHKSALSRQARDKQRTKDLLDATIQTMVCLGEMRDPYTSGHQLRTSKLAYAIAQRMNLDSEQCEGTRIAAMVHDIGKLFIPSDILTKPGGLSFVEYQLLKTHCQAGHDVLKGIEFPWPVADAVLQHHERIDGSGYPHQLSANDIIIEAKIIAVADDVEVMVTRRPYKNAVGLAGAMNEMSTKAGQRYDSAVVQACIAVLEEKSGTIFD